MVTVKSTLLTEDFKMIAISNCVGDVKITSEGIRFEMTDRMFKPFWGQAKHLLNDSNVRFKFHNDLFLLMS